MLGDRSRSWTVISQLGAFSQVLVASSRLRRTCWRWSRRKYITDQKQKTSFMHNCVFYSLDPSLNPLLVKWSATKIYSAWPHTRSSRRSPHASHKGINKTIRREHCYKYAKWHWYSLIHSSELLIELQWAVTSLCAQLNYVLIFKSPAIKIFCDHILRAWQNY